MPICHICQQSFGVINSNHLSKHGMTLIEYKKAFGDPNSGTTFQASDRAKGSAKQVAEKVNKPKAAVTPQVYRSIEELYTLDKTIVIPKVFTRIMEDNKEELDRLVELAFEHKIVDLDTETTGLDVHKDIITDWSFSIGNDPEHLHNFHIPMLHRDLSDKHIPGQLTPSYVISKLRPMLDYKEVGKRIFYSYFDLPIIYYNYGVIVKNIVWDPRVAHQLLNENEKSKKLKDLYRNYLHETEPNPEVKALGVETFEEQFGRIRFFRVPLNVATAYACKDTYMLGRLSEFQEGYINSVGKLAYIHNEIELPLIPVLQAIRRRGVRADLDYTAGLCKEMEDEQIITKQYLDEKLGGINLNSPKQLSQKLFVDLKMPDLSKGSTKKAVLEKLADRGYEVVEKILEFRKKDKLLGTYLQPMPQIVDSKTGKIHCNLNQSGTVTGRFSSNNPNLQNLPVRDPRIRKAYLASEGYALISADYSQIEPRLLAAVAKARVMLDSYIDRKDVYSNMATFTFSLVEGRKVTLDECADGSAYRKNMKTLLLGIMYDMSDYGLADRLKTSEAKAAEIMDHFFDTVPEVRAFIKRWKAFCKREGYVETPWGRKRRLPDVFSDEYMIRKKAERQILNSIIQGGAADVMKLAMVIAGNDQRIKDLDGHLILTVHDELLAEAPPENVIQVAKYLTEDMLEAWTFDVPIEVDTEIFIDGRWSGESLKLAKEGQDWLLIKDKVSISESDIIWKV